MKSRWFILPLCLALLIVAKGFSAGEADGKKKEFKATCPVSGKPAIESSFLELPKDDGKVYFCCENCPKAYAADPKKFRAAMHRQLVETEQVVQVACPVSGEPVDKDQAAESGNAKIHFCCEKCLAKYNEAKDDAAKLKLAFTGDAWKKGFTDQTKCPVSGKPIDPAHFVEYEKQKVYFCCPNCPAAFNKDPKAFLAKLPQFNKKSKDDKAKK